MRNFTEEEKKDEAFLRIANVLYSHWRITNYEDKQKLACGGHTRLFDTLIPDDYITRGESINGKGHREHVIPCTLIRLQAYRMFNEGYLVEDVADMIKKNLIIIHITKEEQKLIDNKLGYKTTMPENWTFDDNNPYARFKEANIEIKFYI